jgi:AbrB family looped-hinge helix DNA binding protein
METDASSRLKMGDKGRVVLPLLIREKAGIEPGDALTVTVLEGGVVQLRSVRHELTRLEGKYAQKEKGKS